MNIKKIKLRLKNFISIKKIVALKRNISMIQINQLIKKTRFLLKNVLLSQHLIELLVNREHLISPIWKNENDLTKQKTKNNFAHKTLWIYLTNVQKYTKNFYIKTNEKLLSQNKSQDAYITLGKEAQEFVKQNNLTLLHAFDDFNNQLVSTKLARLIKTYIVSNQFQEVKFILNTNKIDDYVATIFPIKKFDFKMSLNELQQDIDKMQLQDFKIYPGVNEFLESMATNYFENVVDTMVVEASFINFKNKLIEENRQLKQLDDLIKKNKIDLIKIMREKEIEEIVMITEGNKRLGEQSHG
ncbi:MSC_0622 family F1-like ATPase gamma subunit [[Mycoplasma] testudinis]|uniref:MSC_0622 family F1-like ATPase gamma subunit n=1 Tax=[Mycoplasma] testudinis TaxID=33924 RepID=UPI00048308B4|nr:hypothetical protein [[Mycoplasma] testudinis]